MVRVTTGVKNAHTVLARHKLDQEIILLVFTPRAEKDSIMPFWEKPHSMRCDIWSVQGVIVQYGKGYFQLYRKMMFKVYPTRK